VQNLVALSLAFMLSASRRHVDLPAVLYLIKFGAANADSFPEWFHSSVISGHISKIQMSYGAEAPAVNSVLHTR
jgi:hypothetical protein